MEKSVEVIYQDKRILVAIKPAGVLSTNAPGGMPEQIRHVLGDSHACVRTVHRLDRVVSGLMVFARSVAAASILSRQIREHIFEKRYLAVIHGIPEQSSGAFRDLLQRSKNQRMTYVVSEPGKDVQEAVLEYRVLESLEDLSLVEIYLRTGRTHQIRVQFASRGMPLVGERKYDSREDPCEIALWSAYLGFYHPEEEKWMEFSKNPPNAYPWSEFQYFGSQGESAGQMTEELLDVVDDNGVPTGQRVPRSLAHAKGIQHRTAHLWLVREKDGKLEILLQKRSLEKDSFPGCYDISSAGHIPAGVEYVPSALRELKEELGCDAEPEDLIFCGVRRFEVQRVFHGRPFHDRQVSRIFLLWMDREAAEFSLQKEEVSEVRWFNLNECLYLVSENQIPHCIYLEELRMVEEMAKQTRQFHRN